jgi:cardiolipin synthase
MMAHTGVSVLATGEKFVGGGVRAIEPCIWELISEATSEIQIVAYRIDAEAEEILDLLERAVRSGIRVTLVISDLQRQPSLIRRRLLKLGAYGHTLVVDFARSGCGLLHAKVVVVDRKRAVVGSANLTAGGLGKNHEIAVLVEGETAWQIASLIDLMAEKRES